MTNGRFSCLKSFHALLFLIFRVVKFTLDCVNCIFIAPIFEQININVPDLSSKVNSSYGTRMSVNSRISPLKIFYVEHCWCLPSNKLYFYVHTSGIDGYAQGNDLQYICLHHPTALLRAEAFGYDVSGDTITGPDGYKFKILAPIKGRGKYILRTL